MPRCDGLRLGEPERVVEVDLVVVGVHAGARRDQRVGHPAVVGGDEHAGHDDDARALGDRAHGRRPRPVQRFGDRRERHAEPAHRRLGEQHQPGAGVGGAAGVVLDQAEVGGRFCAALDLREGNPHAVSLVAPRADASDHGTERTPSRIRRRGGSTGNPSARSSSSIARQRTRGPNTPWPATLAHARSAAVSSVWMGWPATLWWISTLGSRSARSDGRSIANGSQASVRLIGPSRVEQHPAAAAAQLVARAVDDQPARRQPAPASAPTRRRTASTGYWRSTLNARTKTGRSPANSKPPSANSTPSRERRHSFRVDLQADDADVGAHRPQPGRQLAASSPAARRSRGRPPAGRRRPAARCAPAASAPASGRCGAAGCNRWCRG